MDAGIGGFLLAMGIWAGTIISVSWFAKYCPKEKTYELKLKPLAIVAGKAVSTAFGGWMGAKNAEKLEEGIFKTIAYWVDHWIEDFMTALTSDNTQGN